MINSLTAPTSKRLQKILEKTLLPQRHHRQEIEAITKNRLFVYKQYVRPLLLYGCAIWGSAGYVHIDSLQRLQNKALRTIARAPRFLPRYILHEELRVEPIHTIIAELSSNFHSTIPYHNNATINSQNHFRNLPHLPIVCLTPHLRCLRCNNWAYGSRSEPPSHIRYVYVDRTIFLSC
ncbi:hypothetical protein TNCV_4569111 [Trichonephila clavipes]|nr:hypothetical protein TNCV_4569111 [Trichonephila clavipes]